MSSHLVTLESTMKSTMLRRTMRHMSLNCVRRDMDSWVWWSCSIRKARSQWKTLIKNRNTKKKMNLNFSSSLKIVSARHVSVMANHIFSSSLSTSAARRRPRNSFRKSDPRRRATTSDILPRTVRETFDVASEIMAG